MLYNRTFEGNRYKIFSPAISLYNFYIPTGVTRIKVTIVGAGGAGGVGFSGAGAAGGGSGGALQVTAPVVAGDLYLVGVPFGATNSGGVATSAGNAGIYPSASFFDSAVAYSGGTALDAFGSPNSGGFGGSYFASSFWTILSSQNGNNGQNSSFAAGGAGATFTSFFGVSGVNGAADTTGSATLAFMSATGYGAGGGGSYDRTAGVDDFAGSGANGYVRIEW